MVQNHIHGQGGMREINRPPCTTRITRLTDRDASQLLRLQCIVRVVCGVAIYLGFKGIKIIMDSVFK